MNGMWARDYSNGGVFVFLQNDNDIYLNSCIQEILLWKGEASFYSDTGVDYVAIFNTSKFLTDDLDKVIQKYHQFFEAINYDVSYPDPGVAVLSISFFNKGFLKSTSFKISSRGVHFVS